MKVEEAHPLNLAFANFSVSFAGRKKGNAATPGKPSDSRWGARHRLARMLARGGIQMESLATGTIRLPQRKVTRS